MTIELSNTLDEKAFQIRERLTGLIQQRSDASPRSLQKALGPSDIAHPCTRKMAYKLLDIQGTNPPFDSLPTIVGTAVHAWLDSAVSHANNTLGRQRYLAETRVNPSDWLSGSCDLFDQEEGIVTDWKVLGNSSMKKYKRQMNPAYRTQTALYGLGFERAGHTVKYISVMMIPRAGLLTGAHLWLEPYDRAVAQEALDRYERTLCLLSDLRIEENPQHLQLLEKAGDSCLFCPFWSPKPEGPYQCEGVSDDF